jgi:predicted  nucleic acid-binding Zn-ribbon protein
MAETLNTRVTRIEKNLGEITEKQSHLDDLVKILLNAQIRTEKRFQETDERIEKLVSAIGKLIPAHTSQWEVRRLTCGM